VRAFKEMHNLGVLHGDIREENILLNSNESVWIIDLEWAKYLSPETDPSAR
jgi:RIO-like serine/threonine protein kinase